MQADKHQARSERSAVIESASTAENIATVVQLAGEAHGCLCVDVGQAMSGLRWVAIHSNADDAMSAKRDVCAALSTLLIAADRGDVRGFRIIAGADLLRRQLSVLADDAALAARAA